MGEGCKMGRQTVGCRLILNEGMESYVSRATVK